MRVFFSIENLLKASGLAALVTAMSLGRLLQGQMPLSVYIPLTFGVMTFVCGAVTAWGRCAGMPGIWTDRKTLLQGAAVALVVSALVLPIRLFWINNVLRQSLLSAQNSALYGLAFPDTVKGCLALMMWSAGFQILFLQAAPMSLMASLTGNRSIAIVACVTLRTYIAHQQIVAGGVADSPALFVIAAAAQTAMVCFTFSRYGLAPTMLLAAGADLHTFFSTSG